MTSRLANPFLVPPSGGPAGWMCRIAEFGSSLVFRASKNWVFTSSAEPPEDGTSNGDKTAVACSSIDAGPYSSSAPSSRQNIIELSYSRPHWGHFFISLLGDDLS